MNKRYIGRVKWFNNAKGYGFILGDAKDEDLFVEYQSIVMDGYKTLKAGQIVSYTIDETKKGKVATNIELIENQLEEMIYPEFGNAIRLVIDTGNANPKEIASLFSELSVLYRMCGGSALNYEMLESKGEEFQGVVA